MYSLNAPVPGAVERLAADLHPSLYGFETVRADRTLVVKRLEGSSAAEFRRVEHAARRALSGAPACEARIARIDAFETPARGAGPVVYLAVESPGLREIHGRLVAELGAVPGIEGPDYVPHVTLARGSGDPGDADRVRRLRQHEFEPITWTVDELVFWDARNGERAGRVSLPA